MHSMKLTAAGAFVAASALVLAGCAGSGSPTSSSDDGTLTVVAATNVYGDIAQAIGGDLIEVTSIIDSTSQDPHSYEASAKDQLTVSQADLLIENGGGYDAFLDALIEATGTEAPVITAVEYSPDWPESSEQTDGEADAADDHADHEHVEGFNEHVWYDPHTIEHVAEEIAHELAEIDPDNAAAYESHYEAFATGIAGIEASLDEIAASHSGTRIFVTEPVPLSLTAAAGLENATPAAFSEAVEEGQDVPPATLLEALDVIASGEVRALIVNAQTGGAETTEVITKAEDTGIPVIEFTELVPDGETYLTWMQANVDALADTLAR